MSVSDHKNPIGKSDVWKSVRNCNWGIPLAQMVELVKDSILWNWLKRGRGLVEDHVFAILEVRGVSPPKLPLTARKILAVVRIAATKDAVIVVFPILDDFACTADVASFFSFSSLNRCSTRFLGGLITSTYLSFHIGFNIYELLQLINLASLLKKLMILFISLFDSV